MKMQISFRPFQDRRKLDRLVRFVIPLLLILGAACGGTQAKNPPAPWPSSTPEEQGMDSKQLLQMLDYIDSKHSNIHSLLILRNGALVLEAYYPPFGPQDRHLLFSATKSVTSALVGIAVQEGKIKSVDEPFLDYFRDATIANMSEEKEKITIKDLLNMTSGLEVGDDYMGSKPDQVQYSLDQPALLKPGIAFDYNDCNSILLSGILQKTTGMTTREYAQEKLFDPLEIQDVYWASAPGGITQGNTGLMLTPREMAKFGSLYLQKGMWQGKQVIPPEWVEASQIPGYSYQWWTNEDGGSAVGYGEQVIFVLPHQNLVVVLTGGMPMSDINLYVDLTYGYVLPAVNSDQPLAPDPAAKELADRVAAIADPGANPVPALPAMAASVSGKTLRLDENPLGWKTAQLVFKDSRAWLTITTATNPKEQKFEVGLDGLYRKTDVKRLETSSAAGPEQRYDLNPYEFNFVVGMPVDGAVAMKGEWPGEDEFKLTVQDVRDFDLEELTFRFTPPDAQIAWKSLLDGVYDLTLTGKLE